MGVQLNNTENHGPMNLILSLVSKCEDIVKDMGSMISEKDLQQKWSHGKFLSLRVKKLRKMIHNSDEN